MVKKGDRVRHKDIEIDKVKGVFTILDVKAGIAVCHYGDFARSHVRPWNYPVADLKSAE